ncbi:hypothetical protein MNV49_005362 [Pseudohyphozyma bogoriensis]|nr:hypothetical protein MNV49_005362 [Pseudohyphozyma bogoriensis]
MVMGISSIRTPASIDAPSADAPFPKRKLILNAFTNGSPSHIVPGTWRGEKPGPRFDTLTYWQKEAELLERGKFHAVFLADSYGSYDVYKGNAHETLRAGFQMPKMDPLLLIAAMAAVTTNLAFGVTASTTYELPFALARRFGTLDHLTNGRIAWNIVTSHLASAARNMGLTEAIEHDKRYDIAEEYMSVVYKLWEGSWHDDAVKVDRATGVWTDPTLVREINHRGEYYPDIPGPHAEAVFISQASPKLASLKVAEYRAKAASFGRDPRGLKIIASLLIIIGETTEEAQAKFEHWRSFGDGEAGLGFMGANVGANWAEFGEDEEFAFPEGTGGFFFINNLKRLHPEIPKWTLSVLREYLAFGPPGARIVGSVREVADKIEEWVTVGDLDGFNLSHYSRDTSFKDIVDLLIPELQRRGLFWDDYPAVEQPEGAFEKIGITAREGLSGKIGQTHLDPTHFGHQFKWLDASEKAPAPSAPSTEAKGKDSNP